jgi:hypothetical protein
LFHGSQGEIVDTGRNEELLEQCETYSNLHRIQFRGQEVDSLALTIRQTLAQNPIHHLKMINKNN